MRSVPDGYEFAVCLTHDVDRVYKTYQYLYNFVKTGSMDELVAYVCDEDPYWQFERIMDLEAGLDVRSTWFFLDEQRLFRCKPVREWFVPENWKLFVGRYDVTKDRISSIVCDLDDGGWEIGLHGSYESYNNRDRLKVEKETLESVLGHEILGGRQHYLNLKVPETWFHHRDVGLQYDASLGDRSSGSFAYGTDVYRPFNDEFVVFPLTAMEEDLFDGESSLEAAWERTAAILHEARDKSAVTTFLWHPRFFAEQEYPGYADLYERLIREAKALNAWIGPCGELYEEIC